MNLSFLFIEQCRDVEFEVVSTDGVLIDTECGVITSCPLPKGLTLLKYVELPTYLLSVSHWEGNTYVGLYDFKVAKIDVNSQLTPSFLSFGSCPQFW